MSKDYSEEYDYIIIGSGFGGSVSALRLSEKGYKVLVIEKGKWWKGSDFPKTNWNLKRWLWLPALRLHGFFKITLFRHVGALSGVGVGGGSLVYANTLPRPAAQFFTSGSWARLADWEKELEPHYKEAERMLGTAKSPRFFDADIALLDVAKSLGKGDEFEAPNVSVFFGKGGGEDEKEVPDPYFGGEGPSRTGCVFCGQCMTGCPNNAKNSLDKNYLYLAQKRGATILAEKKVTIVKPVAATDGADGYYLSYKSSTSFFKNDKKTVKAKGVIFSGGVFGTVRLLLDMKKKKHLPNLPEAVGDHVRTNNESLIFVVSRKKDVDFSKGIAIGSIFPPNEDGHLEAVRYGEGSGFWRVSSLPLVFGSNLFIRLWKLLVKLITHPVDWLRLYFTKNYSRKTMILLFMQHLDSTLRFKTGFFGMTSSVSTGKKPTPFIPLAKELAEKTSNMVNGNEYSFLTEALTGAPSTAHILGGAVIGSSPENGVIDTDQKVFGYKNMFVCDGSAISANPGVNPSLSITAMTERVMSKIQAKEQTNQN
jgi:cholesterol oxidase